MRHGLNTVARRICGPKNKPSQRRNSSSRPGGHTAQMASSLISSLSALQSTGASSASMIHTTMAYIGPMLRYVFKAVMRGISGSCLQFLRLFHYQGESLTAESCVTLSGTNTAAKSTHHHITYTYRY